MSSQEESAEEYRKRKWLEEIPLLNPDDTLDPIGDPIGTLGTIGNVLLRGSEKYLQAAPRGVQTALGVESRIRGEENVLERSRPFYPGREGEESNKLYFGGLPLQDTLGIYGALGLKQERLERGDYVKQRDSLLRAREILYEEGDKAALNYLAEQDPWKQLAIDTATDPASYLGFGLPARALQGLGLVKAANVAGKVENIATRVAAAPIELPFKAARGAYRATAKIPDTPGLRRFRLAAPSEQHKLSLFSDDLMNSLHEPQAMSGSKAGDYTSAPYDPLDHNTGKLRVEFDKDVPPPAFRIGVSDKGRLTLDENYQEIRTGVNEAVKDRAAINNLVNEVVIENSIKLDGPLDTGRSMLDFMKLHAKPVQTQAVERLVEKWIDVGADVMQENVLDIAGKRIVANRAGPDFRKPRNILRVYSAAWREQAIVSLGFHERNGLGIVLMSAIRGVPPDLLVRNFVRTFQEMVQTGDVKAPPAVRRFAANLRIDHISGSTTESGFLQAISDLPSGGDIGSSSNPLHPAQKKSILELAQDVLRQGEELTAMGSVPRLQRMAVGGVLGAGGGEAGDGDPLTGVAIGAGLGLAAPPIIAANRLLFRSIETTSRTTGWQVGVTTRLEQAIDPLVDFLRKEGTFTYAPKLKPRPSGGGQRIVETSRTELGGVREVSKSRTDIQGDVLRALDRRRPEPGPAPGGLPERIRRGEFPGETPGIERIPESTVGPTQAQQRLAGLEAGRVEKQAVTGATRLQQRSEEFHVAKEIAEAEAVLDDPLDEAIRLVEDRASGLGEQRTARVAQRQAPEVQPPPDTYVDPATRQATERAAAEQAPIATQGDVLELSRGIDLDDAAYHRARAFQMILRSKNQTKDFLLSPAVQNASKEERQILGAALSTREHFHVVAEMLRVAPMDKRAAIGSIFGTARKLRAKHKTQSRKPAPPPRIHEKKIVDDFKAAGLHRKRLEGWIVRSSGLINRQRIGIISHAFRTDTSVQNLRNAVNNVGYKLDEKQAENMGLLLHYVQQNRAPTIRGGAGGAEEVIKAVKEARGQISQAKLMTLLEANGADEATLLRARNYWANELRAANEAGYAKATEINFDYTKTDNFEEAMRYVAPFLIWPKRALPFYLEALSEHPGFILALSRYFTLSEDEVGDLPPRFKNLVNAGDLGSYVGRVVTGRPTESYFNPVSVVLPFAGTGASYKSDTTAEKILNTGQAFGLGVFPWYQWGMNALGLMGDNAYYPSALRHGSLIEALTNKPPEQIVRGVGSAIQSAMSGRDATPFSPREYAIAKRIDEKSIEETGQPQSFAYEEAKRDPKSKIYKEAAADTRKTRFRRAAIGMTTPFYFQPLTETERDTYESRSGIPAIQRDPRGQVIPESRAVRSQYLKDNPEAGTFGTPRKPISAQQLWGKAVAFGMARTDKQRASIMNADHQGWLRSYIIWRDENGLAGNGSREDVTRFLAEQDARYGN